MAIDLNVEDKPLGPPGAASIEDDNGEPLGPPAAAAEPEEPEEGEESEEDEEPEEGEESEESEAPDPEDEDSLEAKAAAAAAASGAAAKEVKPDEEIKVGGKTYKVKDLVDGALMRADYTRKTTQIAEERKAYEEFRIESELDQIPVDDFVERMNDPSEVIHEFMTGRPAVWARVEQMIIDRYCKLDDLRQSGGDEAVRMFLENERHTRERWAESQANKVAGKIKAHRQSALARAEARKAHATWRDEAMKAVGLDPERDEHVEMVRDAMNARYRGKPVTKETFDAECSRVAKALNVKPPKAAKKPKAAPAPAAPPKPALPPVRAAGNKRPAKPAPAAEKSRLTSRQRHKSLNDFFADLRNS